MKTFLFQLCLTVVLIPPVASLISWLSGHDYLTWGWFFTFVGIVTVLDLAKILWRRYRKEKRS